MFYPELLFKKLVESCPNHAIHKLYRVEELYICKNCLSSLQIDPFICSHHYHDLGQGLGFGCCRCSFRVNWRKSLVNIEMLQQCSLGLLDLLLVYFDNVDKGQNLPINASNKFLVKVMDKNGTSILGSAGYKLNIDNYWILENRDNIRRVKMEILAFMGCNGMGDVLQKYNIELKPGGQMLARDLGYNDSLNKQVEEYVQGIPRNQFYESLGILGPSESSNKVQEAYETCIKEDSGNIPFYLECLLEIAKTDPDLEIFAIMEKSKGIPTESELKSACDTLIVEREATDEEILDQFRSNFSNLEAKRKALRVIGASRDSFVILHFLETGQVISTKSRDLKMRDSAHLLPIGLNNVGNICYLNSLLQFFFSFKDVHDVLKSFDLGTESKSEEFVISLKGLFKDMIMSDESSISPDRKIAEMTLAYGEQQDVTECLEAILDMFQTAFKGESKLVIQSLFFGQIKQTLSYRKGENIEVSRKTEEFNSLIVDVFDDIYVCLDAYFSLGHVDIETTTGEKYLSILEAPNCIMIHINRVKFDQEKKTAYKSNEFIQFYESLYLDRYMDYNVDKCSAKKTKMEELRNLLTEKQKLLDYLGKKSDTLPPPLQILENTLKYISKDTNCHLAFELSKELHLSIQNLKSEILNLQNEILSIRQSIDDVYSDMKSLEYLLHAVFIHEGDAAYGHYWVYLWHPEENQWFKYNDSQISRVSESVVFQDTSGKNMNVYALGYIKRGTKTSLLNRTESFRNSY